MFALAEGTDSTVVLAGDFARVNGVPRNAIARLLPDGTLDPVRPERCSRRCHPVGHGDPNGSVIVAGDFSHWGATAAGITASA